MPEHFGLLEIHLSLQGKMIEVRGFVVGVMIGFIVLTGMLPVTPHDDFGLGHAHAAAISGSDSIIPSGSTEDGHNDPSFTHCSSISHFITTNAFTQILIVSYASELYSHTEDFPLPHTIAPATPPPNL